jgi:F0F1-type ATP synthase membrane subunit b/b'
MNQRVNLNGQLCRRFGSIPNIKDTNMRLSHLFAMLLICLFAVGCKSETEKAMDEKQEAVEAQQEANEEKADAQQDANEEKTEAQEDANEEAAEARDAANEAAQTPAQ